MPVGCGAEASTATGLIFWLGNESLSHPTSMAALTMRAGFLTGIAVGPELIMPSEWIPTIWQGGQPEFKDIEQAERIMGIIMARYNEIIHLLDDEPDALEPIFYEAPDGRVLARRGKSLIY